MALQLAVQELTACHNMVATNSVDIALAVNLTAAVSLLSRSLPSTD